MSDGVVAFYARNGEGDDCGLQLGALRDALIDAGASPPKADKAAEELAGYESRLGSIEVKLGRLGGDIRVVQAIGGIIVALELGVLWRLLAH